MRRPAVVLTAALLAGCAHYDALPLPSRAPLAPTLSDLRGMPTRRPLRVSDVVLLALRNSPDLLATRAQRGVSQAQVLQAGLAPNPNLNGAILPLAAGLGDTTAWNLGLTYDIKTLVTLHTRRRAAERFPNLTFGVTGGSDNANVRNIGPQIQLELPMFDRAQGLIATERATRQQLRDEYAARLATATGQVGALLAEMALIRQQLGAAQRDLGAVRRTAGFAEAALQAGNLDERSALDLISARFTKELEIANLTQSLLEQQVAIDTLVGAGMPAMQQEQARKESP